MCIRDRVVPVPAAQPGGRHQEGALGADGVGGWWWFDGTGPGSLRTVPTLVHLSLADAEKALASVDLRSACLLYTSRCV